MATQGIYLVYHVLGNQQEQDHLTQFIENSCINAVVIDLKNEAGLLSYHSQVPLAMGLDANRRLAVDMPQLITWLKSQSIYTIARISTFRDSRLAMAHPDLAIHRHDGTSVWQDSYGMAWVDPFADDVWSYNLQLAREAVGFGFDEILFDALRFPASDTSGTPIFRQSISSEDRISAITGFLSAARGATATSATKMSANIIGQACWRDDDAMVGQDIARIVPYLDVIAPQLYPSMLKPGTLGYANPIEAAREITADAVRKAVRRTRQSNADCQVRPWIQDFPDPTPQQRPFGEHDIKNQISGAVDGGAAGFFGLESGLDLFAGCV